MSLLRKTSNYVYLLKFVKIKKVQLDEKSFVFSKCKSNNKITKKKLRIYAVRNDDNMLKAEK